MTAPILANLRAAGSGDGDASSDYATLIKNDGAVFLYEMEENIGATVAEDETVNSLDGTYATGGITFGRTGPLVDDDADRAVLLDGAAGWVQSADLTLTDRPSYPFSMEVWVRPSSGQTAADNVMVMVDTGDNELAAIRVGALGLVWRMTIGSETTDATTVALKSGLWQHLVVVFVDATERYLYQNAAVIAGGTGQTSATWAGNRTTYQSHVGANRIHTASFFGGTVSRAAYYNDQLTAAEIAEHYYAGHPPYGLVGDLLVDNARDGELVIEPARDGVLEASPR